MKQARFSTADQEIFKSQLKNFTFSKERMEKFQKEQIDFHNRTIHSSQKQIKDIPDGQFVQEPDLSDYKRLKEPVSCMAFSKLTNASNTELEDFEVGDFKNEPLLGDIQKNYEKEVKSNPVKDKNPLFANGEFRNSWKKSVAYSTEGDNFDRIFKSRMEEKARQAKKKAKQRPKLKVEEKKKKKFRPVKAMKKWYEIYVKKEKKPETEKPWFPLEEANRLRVLAGIPPVEPEIEAPKRSRWWKFRVFMFRQLSLIIWRIHPESKVETKSYVVLPDMSTHRNVTPDLEFLIRQS